jgi:hypothetical protein
MIPYTGCSAEASSCDKGSIEADYAEALIAVSESQTDTPNAAPAVQETEAVAEQPQAQEDDPPPPPRDPNAGKEPTPAAPSIIHFATPEFTISDLGIVDRVTQFEGEARYTYGYGSTIQFALRDSVSGELWNNNFYTYTEEATENEVLGVTEDTGIVPENGVNELPPVILVGVLYSPKKPDGISNDAVDARDRSTTIKGVITVDSGGLVSKIEFAATVSRTSGVDIKPTITWKIVERAKIPGQK